MPVKMVIVEFLSNFFKHPDKLGLYCNKSVTLYWRGEPLVRGLSQLQTFAREQMECFSNFEFDVQDIVESGDKVAVRLIQRGTLQSTWESIGNIGADFEVDEMMFFFVEDGLIKDIWPLLDMERKKQQLSHKLSRN